MTVKLNTDSARALVLHLMAEPDPLWVERATLPELQAWLNVYATNLQAKPTLVVGTRVRHTNDRSAGGKVSALTEVTRGRRMATVAWDDGYSFTYDVDLLTPED